MGARQRIAPLIEQLFTELFGLEGSRHQVLAEPFGFVATSWTAGWIRVTVSRNEPPHDKQTADTRQR